MRASQYLSPLLRMGLPGEVHARQEAEMTGRRDQCFIDNITLRVAFFVLCHWFNVSSYEFGSAFTKASTANVRAVPLSFFQNSSGCVLPMFVQNDSSSPQLI